MYANVNMQGRVINDPEIKVGKNGKNYVTFRLVVNQQYGEQETSSFFNCTGSEAIASRIAKAGVNKGSMIHVTGNLTIREFTDREGCKRQSADVGILDWDYTGSKPKSGETAQTAPAADAGKNPAFREQYVGDPDDLPL